jgi:alkanesulfonate monooxygenase SsuD/methylene tetrahydromethanopterin reductase-like flavin-dependent oxidoreductase (luciferase family)
LSNNRVNLGLGAGWMREEFAQTGQTFEDRGRRLDDMIPALRELWRGGWVEYHGTHYDFGPLQVEPSPTQPIPIWCGGHSRAALRRAARLCDGWVGNAYPIEECERYVGLLRKQLEEAGRGDDPFEIILGVQAPPTPEVCERLAASGVTGLMCVPWLQGLPDDHTEIAGAQRGTDLERKIEATHRFAEQVVVPAADI